MTSAATYSHRMRTSRTARVQARARFWRDLRLSVEDAYWIWSSRRFDSFIRALGRANPQALELGSIRRAERAQRRALREVPAYQTHVARFGGDAETDKANYVQAYSIPERCRFGQLPLTQTVIDESSGSTGVALNWVRSPGERKVSHRSAFYFARYCFGNEPTIVLNAFSMGAWATGLNMGLALMPFGIVKNVGPDLAKIFSTMQVFGPTYRYLMVGYPPFMKQILDEAQRTGFPIAEYRLDCLVGGEGMSEGLRDHLQPAFRHVFSGYGATDLELGLAGETPVSVAIRRLARDNSDLRKRLFGDDSRLPMVFQYNPLMHHIEATENSELVMTILRRKVLSPRVRYNVHDEGGVLRFDQMTDLLRENGFDISAIGGGAHPTLPLPFVWVYGRRDSTVSVMGANVYPEDFEDWIYSQAKVATQVTSFCMEQGESADGSPRFCFHLELTDPTLADVNDWSRSLRNRLRQLNADYRQASDEDAEATWPIVHLHQTGTGPFTQNSHRIKHVRLIR